MSYMNILKACCRPQELALYMGVALHLLMPLTVAAEWTDINRNGVKDAHEYSLKYIYMTR